jgi:hypothetical protein
MVVPIALGVVLWVGLPRVLRLPNARRQTVLVLFAFAMAVSLAIQSGHARRFQPNRTIDGSAAALTSVLSRSADYFADAGLIERIGPRAYAAAYPGLVETRALSFHSWTHPPGAPLVEWAIWRLAGRSDLALALTIALIGALGVLPTTSLARTLFGEEASVRASVLFVTAPAILLFSATSADAIFMTVCAVAFVAAARVTRSRRSAIACGATAAIACCFTWGALALIPFAGWVVWTSSTGHGRRTASLGAVAGFVGALVLLRLTLRLDLPAVLLANVRGQLRFSSYRRSYWYWVPGNVFAFLLAIGVPATAALARSTAAAWRSRSWTGPAAILWAIVAVATLSGVFKGETDHNWLFLVPLAVAVGAAAIDDSWLRPSVAFGLGQATVAESLLYTGW